MSLWQNPPLTPSSGLWKADGTAAACWLLALVASQLPSPMTAAFLFAVPSAVKSPSLQTNPWGYFSSSCRTAVVRFEPYFHQEHEQPSDQFSSVTQSCLTLCNPLDCSTSGFAFHYQLPEPAQTHVHRVGDAIQPSHPLSSPLPPVFNLSQNQGLFQ